MCGNHSILFTEKCRFGRRTSSWQLPTWEVYISKKDGMDYRQAAERLRKLVQSGLLRLLDIEKSPSKFFEAHRILAQHATRLGPGFFIRFTVHYNLFAGTVVGLGSDSQIADMVIRNKEKPKLGCFALTELFAGVNSGLVVATTATFENEMWTLNTPDKGASKNWISQGLVADEAVVAANVTVNGKNLGPLAFLVRLRDGQGKLLPGISADDMGRKTVGNDLDNARIVFNKVSVPLDSLLSRYIQVDVKGCVSYPFGSNIRTMDMIGQRLFTGRIAVAQAALEFAKSLYSSTNEFADAKLCWIPGGKQPLSKVPQVAALFQRAKVQLALLEQFMEIIERELCECLVKRQIPPLKLQQAIAVGKVRCLEDSIALCHSLKQEVGSYALMAGTGFEQLDFLQCCKFAEGDSRILMQKMARDIFGRGASTTEEKQALKNLQVSIDNHVKSGLSKSQAWDKSFELVYELAEVHMQGVLKAVLSKSKARL